MTCPETLLPPGFRFHPTDEELILHYLRNRAAALPCPVSVIAEVDIYKFDPWDLPAKAMYGDREWYFFTPRDRKYPNGVRPNRAAGSGYWKATGTDKVIVAAAPGKENIGVKKALVFYKGRPPKGAKTDWIMHEYRLAETPGTSHTSRPVKHSREYSSMRLDDWVLCRIYKKCGHFPGSSSDGKHEDSVPEDVMFSSPAPGPAGGFIPQGSGSKLPKSFSFGELFDDGDYSFLARLLCENTPDMAAPELGPLLGQDAALSQTCLWSAGDGGAVNFSLPKLSPVESPVSAVGSPKRQRTAGEQGEEGAASAHPRKKSNSSCTSYTSFAHQLLDTGHQCNVRSPSLLHQQILLNSQLGFH